LHEGYQLGLGTGLEPLLSTLSAEFDEHRIAGRSLSLERAADLALRTLDEELALTAKRAGAVSEVADKASSARTATPADEAAVFRREGDVWAVSWAGRTVRLRGARGFAYLAVLLRHPDLELHATDVVRLATGDQVGEGPPTRPDGELATSADLGHAGTLLDARARDEYRTRLTELREEVAEAEGLNDLGRAERLREELEMLLQQLAGGKRGRTAAAHGERARVAVTKGLKRALERIAASHPELGRHLTATVRRGYFCVYRSDPARSVRWECESQKELGDPMVWVPLHSIGGPAQLQANAPPPRRRGSCTSFLRCGERRWRLSVFCPCTAPDCCLQRPKTRRATSRNSRQLSARLGRCQHVGPILSRLRLPVPPPRRAVARYLGRFVRRRKSRAALPALPPCP
jgi:hypothetical protein